MKKGIVILIGLVVCVTLLQAKDKRVKLAFFGSSVCFGTGADRNEGYAWQFYYQNGGIDTTKFKYINVSIGGDNTLKVEQEERLAKRLLPQNPDIVVIGLSLANEGIVAPNSDVMESVLEQFRSRLLSLADSLSALGVKVVIANCYAQSSFSEAHYEYTKQMNQTINRWNYPSINLMGSIDDGHGRWVKGFVKDPLHPNSVGHYEMSMTIVPTLFQAIMDGKRVPKYDWNNSYCQVENPKKIDLFTHEVDHMMHSFTAALRFKNSADGAILKIESASGVREVIVKAGEVSYGSFSAALTKDTINWNHIVVSHNYANEQTVFAINGQTVGVVNERIIPSRFVFGGGIEHVDLKDITLHRSSLNVSEIRAIHNKQFIQSSLEIYSPLTAPIFGSSLVNMAQSYSVLKVGSDVKLGFVPKRFY